MAGSRRRGRRRPRRRGGGGVPYGFCGSLGSCGVSPSPGFCGVVIGFPSGAAVVGARDSVPHRRLPSALRGRRASWSSMWAGLPTYSPTTNSGTLSAVSSEQRDRPAVRRLVQHPDAERPDRRDQVAGRLGPAGQRGGGAGGPGAQPDVGSARSGRSSAPRRGPPPTAPRGRAARPAARRRRPGSSSSPGRAPIAGRRAEPRPGEASSESGIDIAATMPTSALAVPAPKPASRHSVANQPKTAYAISDWRPKNSVIAQPSRVRAMSPKPTSRTGASRASSRRTSPNHGTRRDRRQHRPDPDAVAPAAERVGDRDREQERRGQPDGECGRVERGEQPDPVGEVQPDQRGDQHVGHRHARDGAAARGPGTPPRGGPRPGRPARRRRPAGPGR